VRPPQAENYILWIRKKMLTFSLYFQKEETWSAVKVARKRWFSVDDRPKCETNAAPLEKRSIAVPELQRTLGAPKDARHPRRGLGTGQQSAARRCQLSACRAGAVYTAALHSDEWREQNEFFQPSADRVHDFHCSNCVKRAPILLCCFM